MCAKPNSCLHHVNPPSTKQCQTSIFKSRRKSEAEQMQFGVLHSFQVDPALLLSIQRANEKQLHVILMDLINHKLLQHLMVDNEGANFAHQVCYPWLFIVTTNDGKKTL